MKNKDYWKSRMEELEDEQYQRSMAYYKDVQEQFRQASNSLQMDIERWYRRLADNNEISYTAAKKLLKKRELEEFKWTVEQYIKAGEKNALDQRWMKQLENASARYHIDRLEAMKLQIRQHAELLFTQFEGGMTDFLQKDYAEQFYRTAYEVSKGAGIGFNLSRIDSRRIDALIRRPWAQDGKAFSDRIWSNKDKLVNNLHTELTQCIIRGESPAKAIDRLAKKMEVSKAQAGNLIMTESAAIASAAQEECFRELDLEKFEFDATLDGKTCDVCAGMDGQLFLMSQYEVGVTAPPIHPRCRCCVLPGFDDWEELGIDAKRAARDPETGDTVYVDGNLKYEDWKKQNINRTPGGKAAERNTYEAVSFDPKNDYSLHLEGYSEQVNQGLSDAARSVAQKGGSDGNEHMYLVDLESGALEYYETDGLPNEVGYDFWKHLDGHKKFAFVHNHNTNSFFSEIDMRTLLTTEEITVMIAVRNDGVKYVAERAGDVLEDILFDDLYEDDLKKLNQKIKDGIISMAERSRKRELLIVENLLRDYTKGKGLVEYDGRR